MQNNWTIYSRVLWSIITACYSPLSWRHSHACVSRIICCQSCFRILLVTMYSTVRSVDCLLQYLASRSVAFANTHTRIHKTYTSVHSGKTTEEFNSFSFVSCRGHILRMTLHWLEITLKLYTSLSRTVDRKTVTTQIAHTPITIVQVKSAHKHTELPQYMCAEIMSNFNGASDD